MKRLQLIVGVMTLSLLFSCSQEAEKADETNQVEQDVQEEVIDEPKEEEKEEESPLGAFQGLVGSWTVDAATAGVQLDLTFTEEGGFTQKMGTLNGEGNWEIVDDEHIKISTQHTKGQTWLITDLTENSVNICWNPDKPDPKTIPMERVK